MISFVGRHGVEPLVRFLHNIRVDNDTGCIEWTGDLDRDGYGRFWEGSRSGRAHRWILIHLGRVIPSGWTVDHLCRNKTCVNPEHLEIVTRAENNRRAKAAVTHCPQGHEYTSLNTYVSSKGSRACRTCHRDVQRRRRAS